MRREDEIEFIRTAMALVAERNYTYYIGGSNYSPSLPSDVPFQYCHDDTGNIFQKFKI